MKQESDNNRVWLIQLQTEGQKRNETGTRWKERERQRNVREVMVKRRRNKS